MKVPPTVGPVLESLGDEVYQKLKKSAHIVYRFYCSNDQNLTISHNLPPDSEPICVTMGLNDPFGGDKPLAHDWYRY